MYQPGDIVLQFSPQLKLGEANKFHCLWEGLFEIVERVSEVTFRIQSRGRHSWCSSVGPFNNLRLYKRAASVDSQGDKPADSDLKNVDVLGDASGLTSVLCGEQNVYEAKQPSLPASVGDHQETVVMQDEFPLPAEDCVNKRLESLPSPSKELKNPVILLPPHLHLMILICLQAEDHTLAWCNENQIITEIGSSTVLTQTDCSKNLCHVNDLEIMQSSERERIMKPKPKLMRRVRALRERLEKNI